MGKLHQHNLEAYVTEIIEDQDFSESYDIDAILEELRNNDVWNGDEAEAMDTDLFWEILGKNSREI